MSDPFVLHCAFTNISCMYAVPTVLTPENSFSSFLCPSYSPFYPYPNLFGNLEAHQFGSSHVTLFLKLFSKFYSPFSLNIAYRCQVLVVDQKPCISLTSANILLYLILGNQSSIIISTFKIWKLKLRGVKKLTQGQIAVTVRVLTWMQVCLIPRPELIVTKC